MSGVRFDENPPQEHSIITSIEMTSSCNNAGHVQSQNNNNSSNEHVPHHSDLKVILTVLCFIICLSYSVLLVFLLSYLNNNMYYNFIALISVIILFGITYIIIVNDLYRRSEWNKELHSTLLFCGVCAMSLTLMCVLTLLTRIAHDQTNNSYWNKDFIFSALKFNALIHVFSYLCRRHWESDLVWRHQAEIVRLVFDNADIFSLMQAGLNHRGSILEVITQVFCTLSFLPVIVEALGFVISPSNPGDEQRNDTQSNKHVLTQVVFSLCQNLPFLIIRVYIWEFHGSSSLEFMSKNVLGLIISGIAIYNARKLQDPVS